MKHVLIVNFSPQAALRGEVQPCPPIEIDFSHNNYVTHPFVLYAWAAAAACDAYVHIAMESLYTKFEKLVLLAEYKTAK